MLVSQSDQHPIFVSLCFYFYIFSMNECESYVFIDSATMSYKLQTNQQFRWQQLLLWSILLCFTGSLTALVCQHSITPLALPCKLIIPDRGKAVMHTSPGDSRHYGGSGELTSASVCNYLKEIGVGLPRLRKSLYVCPQIPWKMRRSRPRSRSPTLLPSC